MNTQLYQCTKCDGSGKLPEFNTILGGICFKCSGTGKQSNKPSEPTRKYACYFAGDLLFYKSAKKPSQALRQAINHWRRFGDAPAFASINDVSQITVEEVAS